MLSVVRGLRGRAQQKADTERRAAEDGTPPPEAGLLNNTTWLVGSRLVVAALGWGGTVLIARDLDLDGFGRFTLIFAVLGLMSIVTDMGIGRIALSGMLADPDEDPGGFAGAYIALRMVMGLVGYGLVMLIVVLLGYPAEVVQATAVAALVIVLATPSSALEVVFQSRMKMGVVGVAGVTGQVAQFALTAAIAASGGGTVLYYAVPAVLAEVVMLAWKIPAARKIMRIRLRIDLRVWKRLLVEAIPLTLGIGLATLYYRVDSVMLSRLDTFDAVGIYGISYKFVDIVHFVGTAVTVPLLTLLVRAWPDDAAEFRSVLRRGAMICGLLGGGAVVGLVGFAAPLTTALYGADYAVGEDATRLLVLAEFLTLFSMLGLTCLIAISKHRVYPVVMLIGLTLNVSANLVLIPRYSYEGAAAATLGAEVLVVGTLWFLVRRECNAWPFGLSRLLVIPVAVAVGLAVGWGLDQVLPWVPAALAAGLAYLAVAFLGGIGRAAGIELPRRTTVDA